MIYLMRIGFDVSQTGNNKAGCGYFADSLIQAVTKLDIRNKYILYPNFGTSFWDPKGKQTTRKIDRSNVSIRLIGKNFSDSMTFWKNLPSDAEERLKNPDIIHANNYSCPRGLKMARIVYTLHDLNFLERPEWSTEQNRSVCFNGVFTASIYADFILAISRYSMEKFLEFFPHYPRERMRVVYPGSRFGKEYVSRSQDRGPKGLRPGEFWLTVGTLEPRKNLRNLLKAFAQHKKQMDDRYILALAGGKGWLEDNLQEFIKRTGLESSVRTLGYVSDNELSWLYKNCFCFVYPSLYEGFGLPVLEAMNFGAAVITSNATSLSEVGGDAVHYVDPTDQDDIAEAFNLIRKKRQYRELLKRKAVSRAEKFSWEKSAAEVLQIYDHIMTIDKFGDSFE